MPSRTLEAALLPGANVWLLPTFVLLGTLLHAELWPGIASLFISHFTFLPSSVRGGPEVQPSARQVSVEVVFLFFFHPFLTFVSSITDLEMVMARSKFFFFSKILSI